MADLIETPVWEPGIYQIEQTDPVVGGAPDLPTKQGVTNIPAQQLGNRTAYLLAQIQVLQAALGNIDVSAQINAAIADLIDGAPGALDTLNELAAAIGDNDSELAALLAQIAALSAQVDAAGAPIGQIAAFHADVAPAGWVVCDGSPVTALFPDLRAHLLAQPGVQTDGSGDPLLPDYRGEFLRGLDLGRGVDPGRVLGSAQADEFKSHKHDMYIDWVQGNPTVSIDAYTLEDTPGVDEGQSAQAGGKSFMEEAGGTETRPRNIAALICMKAASQAVTAGMADLAQLLTAIATQAEAEVGTNNTQIMTPLATARAIAALTPDPKIPDRVDDFTPFPAANSRVAALHGYGAEPSDVQAWAVCVNASGGYAPGDRIKLGSHYRYHTGGMAFGVNNTEIFYSCKGVDIINQAGGTTIGLGGSGDWKLELLSWM